MFAWIVDSNICVYLTSPPFWSSPFLIERPCWSLLLASPFPSLSLHYLDLDLLLGIPLLDISPSGGLHQCAVLLAGDNHLGVGRREDVYKEHGKLLDSGQHQDLHHLVGGSQRATSKYLHCTTCQAWCLRQECLPPKDLVSPAMSGNHQSSPKLSRSWDRRGTSKSCCRSLQSYWSLPPWCWEGPATPESPWEWE